MKRAACLILFIISLSFTSSCSDLWEPSDREAIRLVESYYLYTRSGKEVDAEIISRGAYERACRCFPVKLRIERKGQESFEKTFYFTRNETGTVEVSEYQQVRRN